MSTPLDIVIVCSLISVCLKPKALSSSRTDPLPPYNNKKEGIIMWEPFWLVANSQMLSRMKKFPHNKDQVNKKSILVVTTQHGNIFITFFELHTVWSKVMGKEVIWSAYSMKYIPKNGSPCQP